MPALKTGKIAPDVELPRVGGGKISLKEALREGPVVLAFFKITCPVCQYAFPYLERLYRNYPGASVRFIGVSQNTEQDTRRFMREFGITFPVALDPEGTPRQLHLRFAVTGDDWHAHRKRCTQEQCRCQSQRNPRSRGGES